jgi:hypothetical protein
MKILISLSGEKFYRGIEGKFSEEYQNRTHIIWVTQDAKYALQYGGHLMEYDINLGQGFNFGFRTLDAQVTFSEIISRIKQGIIDSYKKFNLVSKDKALTLYNELNSLNHGGHKKVWEWYQSEPKLAELLLKSGYTHIDALEGKYNDIRTVGILKKSIIKGNKSL